MDKNLKIKALILVVSILAIGCVSNAQADKSCVEPKIESPPVTAIFCSEAYPVTVYDVQRTPTVVVQVLQVADEPSLFNANGSVTPGAEPALLATRSGGNDYGSAGIRWQDSRHNLTNTDIGAAITPNKLCYPQLGYSMAN